jgi:hypothetical protein
MTAAAIDFISNVFTVTAANFTTWTQNFTVADQPNRNISILYIGRKATGVWGGNADWQWNGGFISYGHPSGFYQMWDDGTYSYQMGERYGLNPEVGTHALTGFAISTFTQITFCVVVTNNIGAKYIQAGNQFDTTVPYGATVTYNNDPDGIIFNTMYAGDAGWCTFTPTSSQTSVANLSVNNFYCEVFTQAAGAGTTTTSSATLSRSATFRGQLNIMEYLTGHEPVSSATIF